MFEGGYFSQEKRYQRMKFPDQERNLETIMMNMQNLFQDFFRLVNVRNIDLKPFLIPKIKLK